MSTLARGPPASARLRVNMGGGPWVLGRAGVDLERDASPARRPPALELVHGQVYAVTKHLTKRPLDALPTYQPFEIPILPAGEPEQAAIWAWGVLVDRPLHEGQKVRFPVLQTTTEGRPRRAPLGASRSGRSARSSGHLQ